MVNADYLAFTTFSFWKLNYKLLLLSPMKRRRHIAWVLMLISIIMLTASVLPHHHHREILCLQHDVTVCDCQCSAHHHHQKSSSDAYHTCNAGCVTKFKSVTPDKAQDTISPDYSFCSLLYTVTDVLDLTLRLYEHNTLPYSNYLERLHSTCLPHVKGLRAPPYVLA